MEHVEKFDFKFFFWSFFNSHAVEVRYCLRCRNGFLTKSIPKPNDRATAMPTTWELIKPFPFLSFWLGVHGPAHKWFRFRNYFDLFLIFDLRFPFLEFGDPTGTHKFVLINMQGPEDCKNTFAKPLELISVINQKSFLESRIFCLLTSQGMRQVPSSADK